MLLGTHTAVLSVASWGQIVQFSHLSAAWLILLPLKNGQSIVPKVCVLSSSDCLAMNSDKPEFQIPRRM